MGDNHGRVTSDPTLMTLTLSGTSPLLPGDVGITSGDRQPAAAFNGPFDPRAQVLIKPAPQNSSASILL